jgi:adenine phosphoribosyltransferase
MSMDLKKCIRDVPDFPEPGILFKDITPLLANPEAFEQTIDWLAEDADSRQVDIIAGIESRGFIFGTPLALRLGLGFVPIRKPGKLPAETMSEEYTLEYGTNTIEMHTDAVEPGQRVLIVDDLLATGGTAAAAARLVERAGGVVAGLSFIIELEFLDGRKKLGDHDISALIAY